MVTSQLVSVIFFDEYLTKFPVPLTEDWKKVINLIKLSK